MIGTELIPAKAARARKHIEEAGLSDFVEIREENAIESLRDVDGPIDFLLNDGFSMLALDVVKLLSPRMRAGAVVVADNVGMFAGDYADYVAFMRDPAHGFRSVLVPYRSGTEYSVRVTSP